MFHVLDLPLPPLQAPVCTAEQVEGHGLEPPGVAAPHQRPQLPSLAGQR